MKLTLDQIWKINERFAVIARLRGADLPNRSLDAQDTDVIVQLEWPSWDDDVELHPICVQLPHQCDKWDIGDLETAQKLRDDLDDMIGILKEQAESVKEI